MAVEEGAATLLLQNSFQGKGPVHCPTQQMDHQARRPVVADRKLVVARTHWSPASVQTLVVAAVAVEEQIHPKNRIVVVVAAAVVAVAAVASEMVQMRPAPSVVASIYS